MLPKTIAERNATWHYLQSCPGRPWGLDLAW